MNRRMLLAALALSLLPLPTMASEDTLDASAYMDQWVYLTEVQTPEEKGFGAPEGPAETKTVSVHPCYALQGLLTCENPVDASIQTLDIYVPSEYVSAVDNGDGTFTLSFKEDPFPRNGVSYTAETAPIIYQNTVGGYRQGDALNLGSGRSNGPGIFANYLDSGFIVACAGARGSNSEVDGTAPAVLVDQKMGIRYLKANDEILPGDSNRIFVTGTSAGGAVAAALAASGNSPLYDAYLEELGAADAPDDVFGAIVFCPIANLDYGDAAFEYLHREELSAPNGWGKDAEIVTFDDFHISLHEALAESFEEKMNSLGISKDQLSRDLQDLVQRCVDEYTQNRVEDLDAFAMENPLLIREGDRFLVGDVYDYIAAYMPRKKVVTALDSLEKTSLEAGLFGGEHFSANTSQVLSSLTGEYPEASEYLSAFEEDLTEERAKEVTMVSALPFLTGEEESDVAPFWRFRNGTLDGDLGAIMALAMNEVLSLRGYNTEYELVWGLGHCAADYGYEDFEAYVDAVMASVSQEADKEEAQVDEEEESLQDITLAATQLLDAYDLTIEDVMFLANILKQYNEGNPNLGLVEEDYYDLQMKLCRLGADAGNGELALWAGEIYQGGHVDDLSEAESVEEAIRWWEKAASLGQARGLTDIGLLYEHASIPGGGGAYGDIPLDMDKAVSYLTEADELGDSKAPRYLGFLYESQEDYENALVYFQKAADSGDITARYYTGRYYLEGKGCEADYEKAYSYLYEAASSEKVVPGVADAQYFMGQIFENGYGTEKSLEDAKYWYSLAATNGSEEAAQALEALED